MGEYRLSIGPHPLMVGYNIDEKPSSLGVEMARGHRMITGISTPGVCSFFNRIACMSLESRLCVNGFGWRVTQALSCMVYKHGSNLWNVIPNALKSFNFIAKLPLTWTRYT